MTDDITITHNSCHFNYMWLCFYVFTSGVYAAWRKKWIRDKEERKLSHYLDEKDETPSQKEEEGEDHGEEQETEGEEEDWDWGQEEDDRQGEEEEGGED